MKDKKNTEEKDQGSIRKFINEWTLFGIWIAAFLVVPYLIWIKPDNQELNKTLLDISTLIPLFLLLSSLIIHIGGLLMGITLSGIKFAQDAWDKYKISRENRKQRTVLEAENKRLQEENERLKTELQSKLKESVNQRRDSNDVP